MYISDHVIPLKHAFTHPLPLLVAAVVFLGRLEDRVVLVTGLAVYVKYGPRLVIMKTSGASTPRMVFYAGLAEYIKYSPRPDTL